jgi:hypothetical protein
VCSRFLTLRRHRGNPPGLRLVECGTRTQCRSSARARPATPGSARSLAGRDLREVTRHCGWMQAWRPNGDVWRALRPVLGVGSSTWSGPEVERVQLTRRPPADLRGSPGWLANRIICVLVAGAEEVFGHSLGPHSNGSSMDSPGRRLDHIHIADNGHRSHHRDSSASPNGADGASTILVYSSVRPPRAPRRLHRRRYSRRIMERKSYRSHRMPPLLTGGQPSTRSSSFASAATRQWHPGCQQARRGDGDGWLG